MNKDRKITSSDLEMAGLPLLWLMIEHVCLCLLVEKKVALFSDNSPHHKLAITHGLSIKPNC
jgi:hypothetical protein